MTANTGLYQRVSDGTDKSVEEQNRANEAAARGFGWQTITFSDKVSASRFTNKPRPGWDALVKEVQAGRLNYVVMWEGSRGDRKLATWAAFLDACRDTGTGIYVTSRARLYDMRNSEDWETLARQGVKSAAESEDISLRTLRGVAGAIELGLPTGRIPYGYRRTYTHESDRRKPLQHQEEHPDEAPLVAEIIGRIAKSEAISAIVKDLDRRDKTTRAGGKWSRSSITRLVTEGVVYIGKRRQNGGPLQDGNWPPIVDEDVYWRAVAVLRNPARKPKNGGIRPGRARWLLSYIATCGECDRPLAVKHLPRAGSAQKAPHYRCIDKGCVSAPVDWLDGIVADAYVRWAADDAEKYEELTGADDREQIAAREQAKAEQARLDDFRAQAVSGKIGPEDFAIIAAGIRQNIARLEKRASELAVPPMLRGLLATARADPRYQTADRRLAVLVAWEDMNIAAQRQAIAEATTPVLHRAVADRLDPARVSFRDV